MRIDAKGVYYKQLNEQIHKAVKKGTKKFVLDNINGQRYIGDGLKGRDIKMTINGVPGNDMAAFMDGPTIIVNSNAQDVLGNTMNDGKVVIYGNAGDLVGHSIRGGKIYVKGNVGYRVGIHMKAYKDLFPVVIAGGTAEDFFGEYMAGGLLMLLGLNIKKNEQIAGNYIGTGMHGGAIYIRGKVEDYQLGAEVKKYKLNEEDKKKILKYLKEYCIDFDLKLQDVMKKEFIKLIPNSHRPYGKLYAY